jgi:LysM repeat protein
MSQHLHAQTPVVAPATAITMAYRPLVQRSCACGGPAGPAGECESCQEKKLQRTPLGAGTTHLRLGSPHDPAEAEADRVAEAVVGSWSLLSLASARRRVESAHAELVATPATAGLLQRQADDSSPDEEPASPEEAMADDDAMDQDPAGNGALTPDESGRPKLEAGASAMTSTHLVLPRSGGRPLSPGVRERAQAALSHDLSRVRVHTGEEAAVAARQVSARAFTVRSDIYFGRGQYQPGSNEGLRLLAHELTHVVQQGSAGAAGKPLLQRKPAAKKKAKKKAKSGPNCRKGACDGVCPGAVKQPIFSPMAPCSNETCSTSDAADVNNAIRKLNVRRADYSTDLEWGPMDFSKPAVKIQTIASSPNLSETPTVDDVIGVKCTACHTNKDGDGMGWFTGFQREYLNVGFHNSQKVASGTQSHGCVRAICSHAEMINKHTSSGKSKIVVDKPKLVLASAAASSPAPGTAPGAAGRPSKAAFTYKVQAGDTVGELAVRFHVSEEAIAKANGLKDVHLIKEGQDLTIPAEEAQ